MAFRAYFVSIMVRLHVRERTNPLSAGSVLVAVFSAGVGANKAICELVGSNREIYARFLDQLPREFLVRLLAKERSNAKGHRKVV